jgi:LysR family glycine cleavage system transcriptional activator
MPPLARTVRSPRQLLIFEAAARLGSCSAAAREFNLTQPSVSRNIADLEEALTTALFVRKASGLELTPDGQSLYRTLSEALHRIDDTLHEISQRNMRKQVVELSLSTAFVTHWFVPRMREFQIAFPDVDLRFQLISGSLRGSVGSVDLAMRRTNDEEIDEWTWPFCQEIVLPVCSPSYLKAHGTFDAEPFGQGHVLLELPDSEITWRTLLDGATRPTPRRDWIEFSDYAVVLQTAVSGQGVALGWVSAISRMLVDRTLVPASSRRVLTGRMFSLIAPRGRPVREIVLRIRDWMMEEMRKELCSLAPLLDNQAAAPPKILAPLTS